MPSLLEILLEASLEAVEVSLLVFLMMVIVDYANVWTQGRLATMLQAAGPKRQYLTASFLGVLPGCLGVFLVVTLYIRGMLSFGSLTASFLATTGDVSFLMLAKIPKTALVLFGILFVTSAFFGYLVDRVLLRFKIRATDRCQAESHHLADQECRCWPEQGVWAQLRHMLPLRLVFILSTATAIAAVILGFLGPEDWNWERFGVVILLLVGGFVVVTVPDHYLQEHIGHHIARHHLPRIFAWTLGTLLLLTAAEQLVDVKAVASEHVLWILVAGSLAGLVPDSGPQLAFVILFAADSIPFSVLLANSMSQSGHGLLPLLAVSGKDSLLVKGINVLLGLSAGLLAYACGF